MDVIGVCIWRHYEMFADVQAILPDDGKIYFHSISFGLLYFTYNLIQK